MPLPPAYISGNPSPLGMLARIRLLCWLYADDIGSVRQYLSSQGQLREVGFAPGQEGYAAGYYAAILDHQVLVAILGTQSVEQMLGHVVGAGTPQNAAGGGFVNSWFQRTATDMYSALNPLWNNLSPPSSVEIFGHSYGAAVAGLLAYQITAASEGLPVNVVTFGSPRARGGGPPGPPPASWMRVRNNKDVITVMPPALSAVVSGALQTGFIWALSNPIRWAQDGQGVLLSTPPALTTAYNDDAEDALTYADLGQASATAHYSTSYASVLSALPGLVDPSGLLGVPEPIPQAVPVAGLVDPPSAPATQALVDQANQLYYGSTSGPLTLANYPSLQLSGTAASAGVLAPSANIREGGPMPTYSGFTKVTMCINNGTYGRLESHVINLPLSQQSTLFPLVYSLCNYRAGLLGNYYTTGSTKSPGCPQIEFVKLSDAQFEKIGQVVDVRALGYFGPPSPSGNVNAADTAFNSLTVRMQGLSTATNPQIPATNGVPENTTLQVTENPDNCILYGTPNPTFNMGGGLTWINQLTAYLQFLLTPGVTGVSWGFMGLNPNETKSQISAWAQTVTPPGYAFTCNTFGWNTGDRVSITGANPVFNKIWAISVTNTAGIYQLQKPPVSGHTIPTGGKAQRVFAGGAQTPPPQLGSTKAFYAYSMPQGGISNPTIKVSKKNPGRQFLNVSFRSRRIRQR